MTPAIRALDAAGVEHRVHTYARSGPTTDFGREAATALGLDPDRVFKTLVVDLDGELVVAVVPVSCRVAPKAVAVALGGKRAEMCEPARAERTTGYVVGGISPFGQKRALRTVVDESCELHETVFVSGGRRGLDVEITPAVLVAMTAAVVADVAR